MSGRKRNSDTSMDSRYGSDGGRGSTKRYNDGGRDRGRDSDRNGGSDRDRGRRREGGGGGGGGGSYDELADVAARWSEFTVFRLLCPSTRVGSVLGRGGAIIKQLREETGARIRVNDAPQGAGERDVVVWSHESKPSSERSRDDPCPAQIALLKVHARICRGDAANDSDARMRKGGADGSGGDEEEEEEAVVVARLLVPGSQVGCVLGKGGSVVAQMRRDTKTHIKISGSGSRLLPECAAPSDELVQISGDYDGVYRALEMVLERLREFPTRDALPLPMIQHAPPQHSHQPYHHATAFAEYATSTSGPMMYPVVPAVPPLPFAAAAGLAYGGGGGGSVWHSSPPPPPGTAFRPGALVPLPISAAAASRSRGGVAGYLDIGAMGGASAGASAGMVVEVVLRLLCPEARVGSVIGKGGAFIRQVQTETRSRIKVSEKVEDCDERVVIIACDEVASAASSGAEEALMRIVSRAVFAEAEHRDPGPDGSREGGGGGGGGVMVRLLVPHAHTGCLLGKGGSIIQHMRRTSAAHIRVLPAADLPKCGLETDELVQVSGNSTSVALALRLIAAHLRANAVSEAANATPAAATPSQMPAVLSPYPSHDAQVRGSLPQNAGSGRAYGYGDEDMPQQQPSYASAYSDPYGNGAAGGAAAGQSYLSPAQAAPSYSADPSGGAAAAAAAAAAGAGSSGGGGSGTGVSTVLVAVPAVASGAIIGKGGSNIAQIRSISGARVRLYDVAEGEAERLVEVVGTTDQVQAAQALIQAFVIKGTAAAAAAAAGGGGGIGTGGGGVY